MITSLDLSGCTALKTVYARSNQLAELNVTGCNALEILHCHTNGDDTSDHTNHITSLDLKGKSKLRELYCNRNGLTALDLTDCTALVSVDCSRNQLTSLNVSHITGLEYLVCGSNDIGTLDVTNNTKLTHLNAWDCGLREIDVSHNPLITELTTGTAGIMAELPVLRLTYSPGNMPYRTDMKDYTGEDFTNITSVKAYTSSGGEILSSLMADGTASFAQIPVKVVYTYDTGYTGSADISSDIKIALTPAPDNFIVSPDRQDIRGTSSSSGGCNILSGAVILSGLALALRKR